MFTFPRHGNHMMLGFFVEEYDITTYNKAIIVLFSTNQNADILYVSDK